MNNFSFDLMTNQWPFPQNSLRHFRIDYVYLWDFLQSIIMPERSETAFVPTRTSLFYEVVKS